MPYLKDGSLYYRTTGAGKPVVFIHGAAGSGQAFANQYQAFRDIASCYFLDLPGHGQSAERGDLSIKGYAMAVNRLAQEIGEPVVMVGHSMGGAIAIEAALTRPDLIRALILANTGCRLPVSPKILEGLNLDYEKTLDSIVRYCLSKAANPALLALVRDDMRKASPAVVRSDFKACNEFDSCDDLPKIQTPALVVGGGRDVMTPMSSSEQLHRLLPHSKLASVPDGSHTAMLENSDAFNAILRDFLVLI